VIAIGGGGFVGDPHNLALEKYLLDQSSKERPNALMIATARGDDAGYVEKFHAAFLSADVQGAIAADCEEPFCRRPIALPARAAL